MRRTLQPLLAATAGLTLLLSACSGESPTSPKPPDNGGSGNTCTVTVALDATDVTPMAGTAIIIRATVRKGGALVPDGTAVLFTTDFGYFLETGLPSVSKVTQNGFADVTLGATASGLSKIKATFECGTAEKSIEYQPVPSNGPFISSITPTSGSCAGGDSVTINGGRFGSDPAAVRVVFGGNPASIRSLSDTGIVVLTPARTLANPQVPEVVDVMVQFFVNDIPTGNVTKEKAFTYSCVDPNRRMTLSSLTPVSGSPEGGQQVTITGNNFLPTTGSSVATTRVTFGGAAASVVSVTNTQVSVLTPRRMLANPNVPETVDVAVTVDLGLVSQQSGMLSQAYTYRAGGGAGDCAGTSGLFIATVLPEDPMNAGNPDGGDIVVISGGGFTAGGSSTTPDQTDVFFGGVQGVTLSVSDSQVRVTTPRRILSNPDKPETVDVRVVADAGGPNESCVQANGAYTYYPGGYLEPVITSLSPVAGPNDISTRVTIFGRNFKLPMQAFVRVGSLTVEASVVSIAANQIVFLTPVATGPNSGLAGQTADVVVRDPYAGKEYVSPVQFRYYSCPSANAVVPASAAWNVPTVVTISGQNFEEPVEVQFSSGGLLLRPTVTSVSSSLITVLMPAIDPGTGGAAACDNVEGALSVRFPLLATCEIDPLTFTYRVDAMTATSASPTQLNQAGGIGTDLSAPPATITVLGTNFIDPMTVQLIQNGAPVANTTVNNAVVANSGQLSFPAPPVPDSALNTQPCIPSGGTTFTGVRWVPTSFGIRLRNTRTGCTVDLPNVLIYNPTVPDCRASMTLTQVAAPVAAQLCQPYTSGTFAVAGGIPTPSYALSLTNGPAGVAPSPATLAVAGNFTLSGTPALAANGPGQATTTYSATLAVSDGAALTTDATLPVSITVNDPAAPFVANTTATTLSALTAGASASATISFAPAAIGAVTYSGGTLSQPLPGTGEVTFSINPTTGVATLTRDANPPANTGSSTIVITAADAGCGGTRHQATVTLTLQY